MKKSLFVCAAVFFLLTAGLASVAAGQAILSQNAILRESPSSLGRPVGQLNRAQSVEVLEARGDWSRVRAGNQTGWLFSSALGGAGLSSLAPGAAQPRLAAEADEIAMAGKGFEPRSIESQYRSQNAGLNYAAVDVMAGYTVTAAQIEAFLAQGQRGVR